MLRINGRQEGALMFYRVLGEPQIASDLGPGGVPISLAIRARGAPYRGEPHIVGSPISRGPHIVLTISLRMVGTIAIKLSGMTFPPVSNQWSPT